MITNLNKSCSAVDDGSSTWTVTFDVTANLTTSGRGGKIYVSSGGNAGKEVFVSQNEPSEYLGDPVPASFVDLPAGVSRNTFTIQASASDLTVTTTDPTMITNLTPSRGAIAEDGSCIWTVTFDVTANPTNSTRTGLIYVRVGGNNKFIRVTQLVWSPPTDMHDGLANCYIIVPGSSVSIPVTRAITVGGMDASATATVETLWDDNAVINGSPTLSGSGDSRMITVRATSAKGNAVVALKDAAGTIRWSWHIWVTDSPRTANYTHNGYTFMDRNLGATEGGFSLASCGLLYQWGRKDPFPGWTNGTAGYAALRHFNGGSMTKNNILSSLLNPTTFDVTYGNGWTTTLWNTSANKKSIYDPCPDGWRVPARAAEDDPDSYLSPWSVDGWRMEGDWEGISQRDYRDSRLLTLPAGQYREWIHDKGQWAMPSPHARDKTIIYWCGYNIPDVNKFDTPYAGRMAYNYYSGYLDVDMLTKGTKDNRGFSVRCVKE
jgi:hypothetical protein